MGKTRGVYFEIDNLQEVVDFGTYVLLMYYAKQLNGTKAKKLFNATLSECKYRALYDLPINGLDPFDDLEVHFDLSELQEAVDFISDELIPSLDSEGQDLLDKYGGRNNFLSIYQLDPDYLSEVGLNKDEFYMSMPDSLISLLNRLKKVFEYALLNNKPYEVYVH